VSGRGPAGTLPFLLAAVLLATGPLGAQTPAPAGADRPGGWRLGYGAAALRPSLSADAAEAFEGVGRFGTALGVAISAGYDRARFGGGITLEYSGMEADSTSATVLLTGALGQWRPAGPGLGGWRPVVAAGYVHQEIGDVRLPRGSGPDSTRRLAALHGSGVRVGAGAEHGIELGGRLGAFLEASADVVRLGDEGTGDGGLAWTPRLFAGVRWWPGGQAPVGRSALTAVAR
jgi:hypothetical protein